MPKRPSLLSIGLMTGTSMDGIDASLVYTNGRPDSLKTLHTAHFSYPFRHHVLLKALEYSLQLTQGDIDLSRVQYKTHLEAYLSQASGFSFSQAPLFIQDCCDHLGLNKSGIDWISAIEAQNTDYHIEVVQSLLKNQAKAGQPLALISYPGQTLFHDPNQQRSYTLGQARRLAEAFSVPVVHRLRQADLNAGGQGAPLAPLYHQALAIQKGCLPLGVINCGGIANLSLILGDSPEALLGFDTGPGNVLLDKHLKQVTQGKLLFDKDGILGQQGQCHALAFEELIEQGIRLRNFLKQKPPKALDSRHVFLPPLVQQLSLPDACQTLACFTAHCMVEGIALCLPYLSSKQSLPLDWVFCGGGALNPTILSAFYAGFSQQFGKTPRLHQADFLGQTPFSVEPSLFAYLGVRSYYQLPISFPQTTGAPYPLTGGEWVHPRSSCLAT